MFELKWDHKNDTLVVSSGTNSTITKCFTKRLVSWSCVKKLLAQFNVGACFILEDVWRVRVQSWDDELPKDTVDRFFTRCVELPLLAIIIIQRSYFHIS